MSLKKKSSVVHVLFFVPLFFMCFITTSLATVMVKEQKDGKVVVMTDAGKFVFEEKLGSWDYYAGKDGKKVLGGVRGAVVLDKKRGISTADTFGKYAWEEQWVIGKPHKVEVRLENSDVKLIWRFLFPDRQKYFLVELGVENRESADINVSKILPVYTVSDGKNGAGLFLANHPQNCRILENGHDFVFDFEVRLLNGTQSSNSNANHAVHCTDTDNTWAAGFITVDKAFPQVALNFHEKDAVASGGMTPFTQFVMDNQYTPAKPVKPGETLFSERAFIYFQNGGNPLVPIETFADAIARHYNITLPKEVPISWNSWGTKYSHDIDENNMLENLKAAHDKLFAYGLNYFVVDDGWQKAYGDWFPNDKFPHGLKFIFDEAKKLGFKTGMWESDFVTDTNAPLVTEHPDWILKKDSLGKQLVSPDKAPLDLTNPEVQQHLREKIRRYVNDWGAQWLKDDFNYYYLGGKGFYDKTKTKLEGFRDGWKIIREEAGKDVFVVGVAPYAYHYGLVDGMRLALDTSPQWGDLKNATGQGIAPVIRNLMLRYYFHNRVYINHGDLVFLNAPETLKRWDAKKPLTDDEVHFELSAMSLLGVLWKVSDAFVDLSDAQVDLLRRAMPASGVSARPVDLFTSKQMLPQIWHLKIPDSKWNGEVVGLFNWEDKPVEMSVNVFDLGLSEPKKDYLAFSYWEEKLLGYFSGKGKLKIKIPAHGVVVLHCVSSEIDALMLLSVNRHILGPSLDLASEFWNKKKGASGLMKTVPGYFYKFFVFSSFAEFGVVIPGMHPPLTALGSSDLKWERQYGGVWVLSFKATGDYVRFAPFYAK